MAINHEVYEMKMADLRKKTAAAANLFDLRTVIKVEVGHCK